MATNASPNPLGARVMGVSHLALNSSDMARTVEFYEGFLGLPLIKTMAFPGGQHFFFDIGNGGTLAFFWFDDTIGTPGEPDMELRDGAMNHVAFRIPPDSLQAWWDYLTDADVPFGFTDHKVVRAPGVVNDMSQIDDDTYAASFYLQDPDGVQVELCAWMPAWERVGRVHDGLSTARADRTTNWVGRMLQTMLDAPTPG